MLRANVMPSDQVSGPRSGSLRMRMEEEVNFEYGKAGEARGKHACDMRSVLQRIGACDVGAVLTKFWIM
jgi:hypothetical protein